MTQTFERVDWSQELKNLIEAARTPDEQKSATAFANAIGPYLDNPAMLRTLLGKIMQSPTETVAIVAGEKDFATMEDVQKRVGSAVSVVAL